MKIKHTPVFDTAHAEEVYSREDGVPVKYVCTTEIDGANLPIDIFYRDTPHPKFGNYYFGLLIQQGKQFIIGADKVEDYDFAMVESKDGLVYSSYRHDCQIVETADGKQAMIDGGRAYVRAMGPIRLFKVRNGDFEEVAE
jgi:hypothetical protein